MPKKRRPDQQQHLNFIKKQPLISKVYGIYKKKRSPWIPSKILKTAPATWSYFKLPAYVTKEYELSYLNRKPDKTRY